MTAVRKNFRLTEVLCQKLDEIAEHYGMNQTAAIQLAISEKYAEICREKFGYRGSALAKNTIEKTTKKAKAEQHLDQMKAMTPDELTAHLIEIGYFPADETQLLDGTTDVFVNHRITAGSEGLKYTQRHYNVTHDSYNYERDVFTWDELINDMRKEKKL